MNIFNSKTATPQRDPHGRFLGQKKKTKKTTVKPVVSTVTFFGREIRIVDYHSRYFVIDDVLALNESPEPGKLLKKADFDKVKKEVESNINDLVCSDKEGVIKLIRQVKGTFPGPLTRWLEETSSK